MSSGRPKNVYEFKITLMGIQPAIWRRIQVPENFNFRQFHVAIQEAMGWQSTEFDYHLHEFKMINPQSMKKVSIGVPDDSGFSGIQIIDGKKAAIATFFSLENKNAKYEYDFGDGWQHGIVLEGIFPACPGNQYPQCVAGMRACPPEDCGGVYGYEELIEIMANPQHKEFGERSEWLKGIGHGVFQPEHFDPSSVLFSNRQ